MSGHRLNVGDIVECVAVLGNGACFVRITSVEPKRIRGEILATECIYRDPPNPYQSHSIHQVIEPFKVCGKFLARDSKQHGWSFMKGHGDSKMRMTLFDKPFDTSKSLERPGKYVYEKFTYYR